MYSARARINCLRCTRFAILQRAQMRRYARVHIAHALTHARTPIGYTLRCRYPVRTRREYVGIFYFPYVPSIASHARPYRTPDNIPRVAEKHARARARGPTSPAEVGENSLKIPNVYSYNLHVIISDTTGRPANPGWRNVSRAGGYTSTCIHRAVCARTWHS